jgi:uncharacterized membrane-anchored protein YitT (DUF2179 family)
VLFAAGIQLFNSPNNIAPGGVTGISVMGQYLFGIPVSVLTLTLNIPLLLMAWRFLGLGFMLRSLRSIGVLTIALEVIPRLIVPYRGEMMLAALFGGVLQGFGLGLVFMRGSTTGGSDIASRLIQLRFPDVSIGRLIMVVDSCVLLTSAIVYGSIENALYGMIGIFTSTRIVDSVLYGLDTGKVMMIVSCRYDDISKAIIAQIGRGCTLLSAKGSYTGQERPVLLCAIRKNQFFNLKRLVYDIDPSSFIVALEATEVLGEGFRRHSSRPMS